jgi:hypothetical protein
MQVPEPVGMHQVRSERECAWLQDTSARLIS